MRSSIIKAIFAVVSYYLFAMIISWIVSIIFKWKYMHAPGPVHLSIAFFLFCGIIWSIFSGIFGYLGTKSTFHKIVMWSHLVLFGAITLIIVVDASLNNDSLINSENSLPRSVEYIGNKNSKLVIDNQGDTLYYEIKDSVFINKLGLGNEIQNLEP